jgi:hypothetical protein
LGAALKPLPAALAVSLAALALVLGGCGSGGGDDTRAEARAAAKREQEQQRERRRLQRLQRELQVEKERRTIEEQHAILAEAETGAGGAPSTPPDFEQLARSLPGEVGVAIGPPGSPPAATAGSFTTGSAWSTSKVPVALRVLQEAGGPSGLSAAQQDEVRRALTLSDNEAALSLFADLEAAHGGPVGAAAAVDEVLAEAGDSTTRVSSEGRDGFTPFGQTQWSLALQEQFMSSLLAGCVGSPASAEYVLGLMGEVGSDTWGLGSTELPALWKGGWGPGTDGRYLARQMGALDLGGEQVVVALAALPDDGSFTTAQSMATSVAQWAAEHASEYAGPNAGC